MSTSIQTSPCEVAELAVCKYAFAALRTTARHEQGVPLALVELVNIWEFAHLNIERLNVERHLGVPLVAWDRGKRLGEEVAEHDLVVAKSFERRLAHSARDQNSDRNSLLYITLFTYCASAGVRWRARTVRHGSPWWATTALATCRSGRSGQRAYLQRG